MKVNNGSSLSKILNGNSQNVRRTFFKPVSSPTRKVVSGRIKNDSKVLVIKTKLLLLICYCFTLVHLQNGCFYFKKFFIWEFI